MMKTYYSGFLILILINLSKIKLFACYDKIESKHEFEIVENRHISIFGDQNKIYHTNEFDSYTLPAKGCPPVNLFDPCDCNEVSFDGINYQTQVTCKGLNGELIDQAFERAAAKALQFNYNTTIDIFEIKDVPFLNLCCDNMLHGFKFKLIKILDSKFVDINPNSFLSTSQLTEELVLIDDLLLNNLDDGQKLFELVKKFSTLYGIYIISTNLREIPQNAFISNEFKFGTNLNIIRICNSLISKLYDYTFVYLDNLSWIDFGDNKINHVTSKTFTLNHFNDNLLKISLSGNKLTTEGIEEGAFSDTKRPTEVYLNDNQINTLKQSVWYDLILNEKDIFIHFKDNKLICDCRHYWIKNHLNEIENKIIDATCENGKNIFVGNFALCEKAPLLEPFGDVYKKCCRQIQYKNKLVEISLKKDVEAKNTSSRSERLVGKASALTSQTRETNSFNDNNSNQRVQLSSQRIYLSPSILLKKPLKYRRLAGEDIKIPDHQIALADSKVTHKLIINTK